MSKGKEKDYRETLKGDRKSLKSEGGAKKGDKEAIKGDGEELKSKGKLQSGCVDIGRLCSLAIFVI